MKTSHSYLVRMSKLVTLDHKFNTEKKKTTHPKLHLKIFVGIYRRFNKLVMEVIFMALQVITPTKCGVV
jgi:hypothetical protein